MEPTGKKIEEFLSDIPEGFEIPNNRFSFEWKYFFRSLNKNKFRRYLAKCIFCGVECEGRNERLKLHFLEKSCTKIPEYLLTQYQIDYRCILESRKQCQSNNTTVAQKSEFNIEIFNEIALKFVISANISFRVLDNPFLKRLIDYASNQTSECRLYSSTTMKYRILNEFSMNIKSENL